MEILLLLIYSFFVWLIFIKLRWLPWNIVSQCIVIVLPVVAMAGLILLLNIVAPSTHDVRTVNYVIPINPPVHGLVVDVPVEPNRPIKKGDVLFRIDPEPFEIALQTLEMHIDTLRVRLVTAQAVARTLQEQVKSAMGQRQSVESRLELARLRLEQFRELAETGAGNRFDYEQAQADVLDLESRLFTARATEAQAWEKLGAKTEDGEQDEVALVRAQIAEAEAQLAKARWQLGQTVYHAPADGTVIALTLRPGAMAVPLPMVPAMNFIEDEQWILAIFHQNEVRRIKPGQEAEVAFRMHPGRIVKCTVDSIMWATAQGQLPIGTVNPAGGVAPIPPHSLAVRLLLDGGDKDIFLAAGAHGIGAVYTDSLREIQILRKVLLRIRTKLDWLILKLH